MLLGRDKNKIFFTRLVDVTTNNKELSNDEKGVFSFLIKQKSPKGLDLMAFLCTQMLCKKLTYFEGEMARVVTHLKF